MRVVGREDEELMLITEEGTILRTEVSSVNRYRRASRGVTVMKPGEGDRIVSIAVFVDDRPPGARRRGRGNRGLSSGRGAARIGAGRAAAPEIRVYADEFSIYAGNANKPLAEQICRYLRTELGKVEVFKFANENIFVRVMENVREQDVFLVQPTSRPVNDSVMELLIMIDAFKRASAGRITAVMPYYAYGRSDKKDQPRVPITARLVADMLTVAGADRVLTMDLHQGQIQGFFSIPVDELTAVNILSRYIRDKNLMTSSW